MQNHRFLAVTLLAILFAFAADGAIAPDKVKKMKADAPEVFVVEVTKVDVNGNGLTPQIVYTVKVTAVTRSNEGVKPGQEIQIQSYDDRRPIREPGPKVPPRLNVGWKGTAYTTYDAKTKRFLIAVYGHSFEPAR